MFAAGGSNGQAGGGAAGLAKLKRSLYIAVRHYSDASVPHRGMRWALLIMLAILFVARVVTYGGFYLISYVVAIHSLYFFMPMITPLSDPDIANGAGAELPSSQADHEFRPFVPVEPEFVAWRNIALTLVICLFLTMFPIFDIPVFWPILVIYFIMLFTAHVWQRVRHMIKYRYVPWNAGKPKFVPKNTV